MARHRDARRTTSGPTGTSAMLLIVSAQPTDPIELSAACRDALRETDAVLAREDADVISMLLRGLRPGTEDAGMVERRVRSACERLVGPVQTGLALAISDDEPLDLLLRRSQASLATERDHPDAAKSTELTSGVR